MIRDNYKSTKFILAMIGVLSSTTLVWFGKIDGTEYVSLNAILGGAFMAANAIIATKQQQ